MAVVTHGFMVIEKAKTLIVIGTAVTNQKNVFFFQNSDLKETLSPPLKSFESTFRL